MNIKRHIGAVLITVACFGNYASASEVVVSAASSLTNAFKDLAEQYQQAHTDTKILLSVAASDVLMRQIVQGAPVDIYASADQATMDKAVDAGVIDAASRHDFVRNEIVLIVPAQNDHTIMSIADLSADSITRIAFGNPLTVPAGRYTQAALEGSGHWDTVKSKEIMGQSVRQVLDYVARGEVDAGFVFATDAAIMPDRVTVVERLDSPVPVLYPVALVTRDGRSDAAEPFLEYILSDKGQAILEHYGFTGP